MADVKMSSIYKSFGNTEVIHGVDLEIDDHEFVVFVGPSGCLLYTSPSPRDGLLSRMPSSA